MLTRGNPNGPRASTRDTIYTSTMGSEAHVVCLNEGDEGDNTLHYLVDLTKFLEKFNEDEGTTWIQAMPLGQWKHPMYGDINVDMQKVTRMAANVNTGVRGQDLDINYDHNKLTTEAAGWVKEAEARQDGLWVCVEWTKDAFSKIKSKAFRYFSPEFSDVWVHPATKQKFHDVLWGGALTNRPFLKGIQPINLSEFSSDPEGQGGNTDDSNHNDNTDTGGDMGKREVLETMANVHGVKFDASTSDADLETSVAAAVSALQATPAGGGQNAGGENTGGENTGGDSGAPETPPVPESSLTPAMASELQKLAEENSFVAALLADRDNQHQRITQLEAASRVDSVKRKLSEVSDTRGLTPIAQQRLTELIAPLPKELSDKIIDAVKLIVNDGVVQLGEAGSAVNSRGRDAAAQFEQAVTRYMNESGVTDYAQAVTTVSASEPALFEQYRHQSTSEWR
jgi:hypothetical protein